MGVEIERKFLLAGDAWRAQIARSERMVQGYLIDAAALRAGGVRCSVRVRIAGDTAWLNIKSAVHGIERREYDYAIPVADAERQLAEFCEARVEKTRHYVPHGELTFEIDEFAGDNAGLIVAELELPAVDAAFERPAWLGTEVSDVPRYYNIQLIHYPFARWSAAEKSGAA
jgi:adenylate cyclase